MDDSPTTTKGRRYASFRSTEILVALPHLSQVRAALADADVRPADLGSSEALGLARLSLPDVRRAADELEKLADSHEPGKDPLDRVLIALRRYFGHRNAGWFPTLGKNRLVGSVAGGGGIVSHGGGGKPREASEKLTPRGAGPGQDVRVGVLDTRLAPQPWLAGGWAAQYSDILSPKAEYLQAEGHATFVTGSILSQAPAATVQVRHVLDEQGEADCWTVANAIVALGQCGLDILNLSLVCYTEDGQPPLALSTAIDRLDPNIVVVAAAGNHGNLDARELLADGLDDHDMSKPGWPAALEDVVAVGASGRDKKIAPFTPRNAQWMDLLALGCDVLSTFLNGNVQLEGDDKPTWFDGFARWSGTSFAAALVSGAIAAGTEPGRVTARQALDDIRRSAKPAQPSEPPLVELDVL